MHHQCYLEDDLLEHVQCIFWELVASMALQTPVLVEHKMEVYTGQLLFKCLGERGTVHSRYKRIKCHFDGYVLLNILAPGNQH